MYTERELPAGIRDTAAVIPAGPLEGFNMEPTSFTGTISHQSATRTLTEAELIQAELLAAHVMDDDDMMTHAIVGLLEWAPCKRVVQPWLRRLPHVMQEDTALLLATVIRHNAYGLSQAHNLEAEMRWMYFITAVNSPEPSVIKALSGK